MEQATAEQAPTEQGGRRHDAGVRPQRLRSGQGRSGKAVELPAVVFLLGSFFFNDIGHCSSSSISSMASTLG